MALGKTAKVVPMDGFHYDDAVLEARGLRARKGAPDTFDVSGFTHLLNRLRVEAEVAIPVFDRQMELSRAGAGIALLPRLFGDRDTDLMLVAAPLRCRCGRRG